MTAAILPVPDEPAFEIKGTVSSLTVLRLRAAELSRVEAELAARVTPHPQIFLHAPVIVDAAQVEGEVPWSELVRVLRAAKLIPVGVTGARDADAALSAGLAPMQIGTRLRSVGPDDSSSPVAAPATAAAATTPESSRPPMVLTAPVRGGQVTYARASDLLVVASVNRGAQVIADGSVQIWGPLRGRALAGAQGRKDARILCLALDAELVSVAGEYLMAEEIPDALRGKPAQIFLDGDHVRIAAL